MDRSTRTRAGKVATCWCGVCGEGYASPGSLDGHGYEAHKPNGYSRKEWMNGASKVAPRAQHTPDSEQRSPFNDPLPPPTVTQVTVSNPPGVPMDVEPTGATGFKQRIYPPRGDRGNAEKFAGLPWMTWPATEAACEDALNQIAKALEHGNESLPFFSSLRSYITALKKRIGHRPDGPAQQLHAHRSSSEQGLTAKQVA